MITIEYLHHRRTDDKVVECSNTFDSVSKAVRFVYKIFKDKDYCYTGFSCDTMEETEEMNRRL